MIKRVLALLLSVLMIWPSVGFSAVAEDAAFTPADPPEGLYKVLQPIMGRRQLSYDNGYRTATGVTYSAAVQNTPVENLGLYMNVYIHNAEKDELDLLDQAGYRQIDIQRYLDGEYYEVRWGFGDISLQPGWNRLLLRYETDDEQVFTPADDRIQVVNANKQNALFTESASFNFALSYLKEEGACTQYTIIVDDVALVDITQPVSTAMPEDSSYYEMQSMDAALPDQELIYTDGGYRATTAAFTVNDDVRYAAIDTVALYMNLYMENRDLPYHTGICTDESITRTLTLTDAEGRGVTWGDEAFAALELQPGWNRVVWRLTDDAGFLDGIPSTSGAADLLLDGELQWSMEWSGIAADDADYRIQIADAGLVDVSRWADGSSYYDTTYDVLRFTAAEQTYTATGEALTTDWVLADNTTAQTGVDISRHNPESTQLVMGIWLEAEGDLPEDLFKSGTLRLRSVDSTNGETSGRWSINNWNLQVGYNRVSVKLSDMRDGGTDPLDFATVNRIKLQLNNTASFEGEVRMTLEQVQIVDVAERQAGDVAVVEPSAGMLQEELIAYSLNAVDWGADPTGVADSTFAIQGCLDTLQASGGVVYLPVGQYRVEGTLTVHKGVTLRGEWQDPNNGGEGKGTLLIAYAGKGREETNPFVTLNSSACLRDISVWYPEQDPVNPIAYPPTVWGKNHTVVKNVTLYNSYVGFYNDSCSSMLIRNFYATALKDGIYGANAYDIPRIEKVSIDTRYWIESGLPGAPTGLQADQLNSYTRQNTTGLIGGRQDWGYWYDIEINNAKIGIMLFAGNDAVGKLVTRNVQYGIYTTNVNAPGLQITHSDISATVECVHYQVDARQTLVASNTVFRDAPIGIHTVSKTPYGVSLNNCTFENWETYAVYMEGGHLTAANNTFVDEKPAFRLHEDVPQALLTGNRFADPETAVTCEATTLLNRDDNYTDTPAMPDYDFVTPTVPRPATTEVFSVTDYGAKAGGQMDGTAAFQAAIDAAEQAGGGTVYIPGGTYRLDGSLTVPSGVELRGSFDGQHHGNSTFNGTQLYIYGGKNDDTAAPLITLGENAGVRGFTVFYPEQGVYDEERDTWVHTYPYVVQMNAGCWVENVSMVNAYRGIDAITNRCDGLLVRDTTGYTLEDTMQVGHGMTGGTIHNLHLNPSGWTQQGGYPNRPGDWFDDYVTKNSVYLTLGDCTDLQIFSCFNIIIEIQTHLIKDPYTGGCYNGDIWGIAYDASQHGVVAESGIDSKVNLLASMGVYNQQGGGYNVWTKPGFTGEINIFNADAWGSNSKVALVEGGSVNIVQYFSMSAYEALCREGGRFSMYNSVFTSRSGDNSGYLPDITYEPGGTGRVVGTLDCAQKLNVNIEPGAEVEQVANGYTLQADGYPMTFSGVAGTTAATDWVRWDGRADAFNLNNRSFRNLRLWLIATVEQDTTIRIDLGSQQDETMQTAGWTVELKAGENRLNLPLTAITNGENPLNFQKVSHLRITGQQELTLSAAMVVDLTAIYPLKQDLYTAYLQTPADTADCRTDDVQAYQAAVETAWMVYNDELADETAIVQAGVIVQTARDRLIPIDKQLLKEHIILAQGLLAEDYTEDTYAALPPALTAAGMVLADGNATQQSVDQATDGLQAALAGLVKKPTRLKGDVTGDGSVTSEDALLALQAATGKVTLSEEDTAVALVSGGVTVTSADALMILQYATQKITAW